MKFLKLPMGGLVCSAPSNFRLCIHTDSADIMPHLHIVVRKMFSLLLVMYYAHNAKPQYSTNTKIGRTCVDRYTNRPVLYNVGS